MNAARARLLAGRHPQSAEVLLFVAAAYELIGEARPDFAGAQVLAERLVQSLTSIAPEPLRGAVPDVAAYFQAPDPYAPSSVYARLALEPWARHAPLQMLDPRPNECPRCGHAPQLGVLRPAGNGDALFLACSLCRVEWAFRRGTCPECLATDPDAIQFHSAEGWPHVRTQTCDACRACLHLLLPEAEPAIIPHIDELALLPLGVWAMERGYRKVWPNLAGL